MKKLLLLLCCVAGVAGCVRGLYDDSGDKAPPKISSVDEARNYFEKQHTAAIALPEMLNERAQSSTRSGGGTSAPRITLTPNWSEAAHYRVENMDVVDVPLHPSSQFSVWCWDSLPNGTVKHYDLHRVDTRLTMVATPEVGVQMFTTAMLPSWRGLFNWAAETRFAHPDNDFSGRVVYSDLQGSTIENPLPNLGNVETRYSVISPYCIIAANGWCYYHKSAHADKVVVTASRYPCSCGCADANCMGPCSIPLHLANTYMPTPNPNLSYGTGSGTQPPTTPAFDPSNLVASKIFKGSLTEAQWLKLENMLTQVIIDCMGSNLYNGVLANLGGDKFIIDYNTSAATAQFDGGASIVRVNSLDDIPAFMHELFHSYQFQKMGGAHNVSKWNGAIANIEAEAQIARVKFMMNVADPTLKAQYLAQMNGSSIDQNLRVMNNLLNANGTPKSSAHETYFMQCFNKTVSDYVRHDSNKYKIDPNLTTFAQNMQHITDLSKNCR